MYVLGVKPKTEGLILPPEHVALNGPGFEEK
jgi:hypothetical protein